MTKAAQRVLLVINPGKDEVRHLAVEVASAFTSRGIAVCMAEDDLENWDGPTRPVVDIVRADERASDGCDVVVVLGGDGTILRGAERARATGAPVIGVNLGHVGFLAEAESEDIADVVEAVAKRNWHVEERLALDIRVTQAGVQPASTWALNEVSLEKIARQRMIDVVVEVDGRPLSRWGCDGVVAATPTGSTAYAFSAGGPVVWPEVSALLVVPLSAHALFSRPLVISPSSVVAFELQPGSDAVLCADGRRTIDITGGARIELRASSRPVRLGRILDAPFTDRLVAKFALPVQGWRGGTKGRNSAT
ncbi:MAG: NAD kinase [Actinobacteria bacterium]|nr:NAD kinase [Actinomycetota bacterium]